VSGTGRLPCFFLNNFMRAMNVSGIYQQFTRYPEIFTDSRRCREGSIFFALRGERFDGNRFAADALRNGARYAVVDDPQVVDGEQYILVKDSLAILQELSAYHRDRLHIPVVAITGSNGKTTTKEVTAKILSSRYLVKATGGNLNNHIGVPLTLLGMDSSTEIGLVEMGANHPGEIALLCTLAKPDYGLVTNVGSAHLEGFDSLEGVKRAKAELYEYIGEKGGLIFCNGGDPDLLEMLSGIRAGIVYYGKTGKAICSGEVLSADPVLRIRLTLHNRETMEIRTGLAGGYNLENILAGVAVGLHFRVRPENIFSALEGMTLGNNRSERIETGSNVLIMDAYNANPTSMMAALHNFSIQDHPRKALVLGDMLELGENAGRAHREVLDHVLEMDCSEIFLVGSEFSKLSVPGRVRVFPSVVELDAWLGGNPLKNMLILLKGSRGIGLEKIKDRL
jgi:UDP-N-acetylmuramoyl-tripeptide--D-alanyl-D-alanine ligase